MCGFWHPRTCVSARLSIYDLCRARHGAVNMCVGAVPTTGPTGTCVGVGATDAFLVGRWRHRGPAKEPSAGRSESAYRDLHVNAYAVAANPVTMRDLCVPFRICLPNHSLTE